MAVDPYQTLGVTPDADVAQIKRRYRQLVRLHHPDALPVAQRAAAHQQMLAINQAWATLSDPASRARYDRAQMAAPSFIIHPPQSASANFSASTTRNSETSTARTATAARPASTAKTATETAERATAKAANRRSGESRSRLLTQVFEAAELYFFYGKAGEAIGLCRRVLGQDPNNAEAHALLGDIYADQGRFDVAVFMFERAVQSQPQNTLYRQKWQALSSKATGFSAADFGSPHFSPNDFPHANYVANDDARTAAKRASSTRSAQRSRTIENDGARVVCGVVLLLLSLSFLLGGHLSGAGATLQWSPAAPIAGRVLLSTMLSALTLGAALPLLGWITPFGAVAHRHSPAEGAPTSLLVGLAGMAFAPLGWTFGLLLSLSTQRANKSLFLGLSLGVLLAATLAFPARGTAFVASLSHALLWWSGRATFPALLAGWALGSIGMAEE